MWLLGRDEELLVIGNQGVGYFLGVDDQGSHQGGTGKSCRSLAQRWNALGALFSHGEGVGSERFQRDGVDSESIPMHKIFLDQEITTTPLTDAVIHFDRLSVRRVSEWFGWFNWILFLLC